LIFSREFLEENDYLNIVRIDQKIKIIRLILYIVSVALAILYSANDSKAISMLNVLLISVLVITGDESENFSLLMGLQLLQAVIQLYLGSSIVSFLFAAYPIVFFKNIIKRTNIKYDIISLLLVIVLLGLELINFQLYTGTALGTVVIWAMSIVYFFMICSKKGLVINYNEIMLMFTIAFIAVIVINVIEGTDKYGSAYGLGAFNENFRFGDEYRALGGPNTVANIALFVICMNYIYILEGSKLVYKLLSFASIVTGFVFGYVTISRAFLVSLGIIFILIFISLPKKKLSNKIVFFLVFLYFILILVYNKETISRVFHSFSDRFLAGNEDRIMLMLQSIISLFDNTRSTLLGNGVYYQLTFQSKFTAHNLYLDSFVSFGLFGGIAFLYLLVRLFFKIKKQNNASFNLLLYAPLIILAAYNFIIGSVRDVSLYYYLIFSYFLANSLPEKRSIRNGKEIDSVHTNI